MKDTQTEQLADTEQPENQTVLWILWGALTASLGMYAVVGYLIQQWLSRSLAIELPSAFVFFCGGMALVKTIVIFTCGSLFAKQGNYQTYSILRWALAEAIGIYGFALFVLGASWTVFGTFLAWALLLELRLMPTADDQQRFEKLQRQEWGHGMSRSSFPTSPSRG